MRIFLLLLFLPLLILANESMTLRQKIEPSTPGDYIVAEQLNHYCLVLVRSHKPPLMIIEEITVPTSAIDPGKISWKSWVDGGAKGHSSWLVYTMNLDNNRVLDSYSHTEKGWLFVDAGQYLLARFLSLPLQPIAPEKRRRIGPAPEQDVDHRPLWNPPLTFEGKKMEKPKFDVYSGRWPKDGSELADLDLEFYFAPVSHPIHFPYWMEVKSPHYNFKVRVIDSGKGLTSPLKNFTEK